MARNDREFQFANGEKVTVNLLIVDNKDRDNVVCEIGGARFTASEKELTAARAE